MKRFLMTLTAGIVLAVSATTHAQALKVSGLPSAAVMSGDDLLMIVTRLPILANKQIELDALSESITKLGTIASGTWEATPITDDYIASASTWNNSLQAGDIGSTGGCPCVDVRPGHPGHAGWCGFLQGAGARATP